MNKRSVGTLWENEAAEYMKKNGYEILQTNFRCRIGEIDIIAKNEGYLIFAEVKYRKNQAMGTPLEAISLSKQKTIRRTASFYMLTQGLPENIPCRFDAVGILGQEITITKDAF